VKKRGDADQFGREGGREYLGGGGFGLYPQGKGKWGTPRQKSSDFWGKKKEKGNTNPAAPEKERKQFQFKRKKKKMSLGPRSPRPPRSPRGRGGGGGEAPWALQR